MSPDIAEFLLRLLRAQTLQVGADDFAATADLCERAKIALADAAARTDPAQ
jgi:hypothetical protein